MNKPCSRAWICEHICGQGAASRHALRTQYTRYGIIRASGCSRCLDNPWHPCATPHLSCDVHDKFNMLHATHAHRTFRGARFPAFCLPPTRTRARTENRNWQLKRLEGVESSSPNHHQRAPRQRAREQLRLIISLRMRAMRKTTAACAY